MCGFDHQIQGRVELERVMERDDRQVAVAVADELIRLVTGLTARCDCGRRKGERRNEDRTGRTEEGGRDQTWRL